MSGGGLFPTLSVGQLAAAGPATPAAAGGGLDYAAIAKLLQGAAGGMGGAGAQAGPEGLQAPAAHSQVMSGNPGAFLQLLQMLKARQLGMTGASPGGAAGGAAGGRPPGLLG